MNAAAQIDVEPALRALAIEREHRTPMHREEALGPFEGVMTGLVTGGVLWLALASFIFALLRGARLFAF